MNWICDYKEVPASPIPRADTYFIEGSTYDIGGIHGSDIHQFSNTSFSSGYQVELAALANLVSLIYKPLNTVSHQQTHTHTQSNFPGFTAEGKKSADALTCHIFPSPEEIWKGACICHCKQIH